MKAKPTLFLLIAVLIAMAGNTQKTSFQEANRNAQIPTAQRLSRDPLNIREEFIRRMQMKNSGQLSYDRLNGTVMGSSSYDQSMVTPRSNMDLSSYSAEQTTVGKNRLPASPVSNNSLATRRSESVGSSSGYLDSSFNGKGWATTPGFRGNIRSQEDGQVLVLKDGRYVVVFRIFDKTLLARYMPDGKLDKTFGTDGFSNYVSMALGKALLQSDEKIIVAGYRANDFTTARFNYDGTLDESFDGDGIVVINFDSFVGGPTAALGYDGTIVLASFLFNAITNNYDFVLARFKADGSLDKSFGDDGKLTTDFFGTDDFANSITVQRDGKILVCGNTLNPNTGYRVFAIARYKRDGKLDNSFGDNGKAITDFGAGASGNAVAVQQDNKIVVAGVALNSVTGNSDMAVACYMPNGKPDESFDGDGRLTTGFGVNLRVLAVALERRKIIAEGMTHPGFDDNIAFARYNMDGSLDNSFDGDGKLISDFGSSDFSRSIAIQKDGKIIIAGDTYNYDVSNYDYVLARYNSDGSSDDSFNHSGLLIGFYPTNSGIYNSTALQKDGKLVAVGNGFNPDAHGYDDFLVRYNVNGSADSSFGVQGKVVIDFGGLFELTVSTAIQSDGKILVAGDGLNAGTGAVEIGVARFNGDGSPDNSFGMGGMVKTGVSGGAIPFAIRIQNDGKIVVAGAAQDPITFGIDFALVRYNPDGSLDNSFDGDGIQTTDFGQDEFANALALQSDGKMVLAGYHVDYNTFTLSFALARYNTDGSLDKTFDGDGKAITDLGPYSVANALAVQKDGKIIAAGYAVDANFFSADFALARYNPDGTLDDSFSDDGKLTTSFCPGDATSFCSDDIAYSVALQGNDKILVSGSATDYNSFADIALARYNTDGTPDNSFDGDGMLTTDLGGFEYVYSSVWHKGKLYVAGGRSTLGFDALVAVYLTKNTSVNNSIAAKQNSYDLKSTKTGAAFDVTLFPNPAHNAATLQLKGNAKDVSITVADMNGRIVLQGRYNNRTKINLPVEKLASGIYLLTIKNGNESKTLKLVKE